MNKLWLYPVLFGLLFCLHFARAEDASPKSPAPETDLMQTALDYDQMTFAQKLLTRAQAIDWIKALGQQAFADCEGRTTSFQLSSEEPSERVNLSIVSEDRVGSYSENDDHYLSAVAVDANEIVLQVPFEDNELRIAQDGLFKLFGEKVTLADYRMYFVIRRSPITHGVGIATSRWLYNQRSHVGVRTDRDEKHYYESSPIHECRVQNKKYLKTLEPGSARADSTHEDLLSAMTTLTNHFQHIAIDPVVSETHHLEETKAQLAQEKSKLDLLAQVFDLPSKIRAELQVEENLGNEQSTLDTARRALTEIRGRVQEAIDGTLKAQLALDQEKESSQGERDRLSSQIAFLNIEVTESFEPRLINFYQGKAQKFREQRDSAQAGLDELNKKISRAENYLNQWIAYRDTQQLIADSKEEEIKADEAQLRELNEEQKNARVPLENYDTLSKAYLSEIKLSEAAIQTSEATREVQRQEILGGYPQELLNIAPGVPVIVKTKPEQTLKISFLNPETLDEVTSVTIAAFDKTGHYIFNDHFDQDLPRGVTNFKNLRFIPQSADQKTSRTFASVQDYVDGIRDLVQNFRRDTPSSTEITSLADYPLMVTALKRMGYIKDESEDLHAIIYRQPKWEESADKVTFSYLAHFSGEDKIDDWNHLGYRAWEQYYGERAIFTNLFGSAMEQYGDIFFHGLVVLLNRHKILPESVLVKEDEDVLKKKFEAEYETTGRQVMLQALKQSPYYLISLAKYRQDATRDLQVTDEFQDQVAQHPEKPSEDIRKAIEARVEVEFDKEAFGEHFEKIDSTWKEIYVYVQSPVQILAWKSLISFLKHEKNMTLPQILAHLQSAAGYMPGSFQNHPWAEDFYQKLYNEN